jgi:hypothetical protein
MYKFIYNKTVWANDCFRFHFDENTGGVSSPIVKGWFFSFSKDVYSIRILDQAGNVFEPIVCSKIRPKLSEIYPSIENVEYSGFEIDTEKFHPDELYTIVIFKGKEQVCRVLSFVKILPLLYVHIAKTAGSTVNKVVSSWFGGDKSIVHAESKDGWEELVEQEEVNYLSGHIPFKAFLRLPQIRCYKKAITFREPYAHVVSHLSWIRALSLVENRARYDQHPEYIQGLSDKLSNCDLSVPSQLTELIKSFNSLEYRLLDNTQTRYIRTDLTKNVVDGIDFSDALENLKDFDFVGFDNNIGGFLGRIASEYGVDYKIDGRRENVLSNKFGLDLNNQAIKEALMPLVKFDLELYEKVQEVWG